MSENKTELLQVRVNEEMIAQIDRLQAMTKASSRSDAVRRSLGLTEAMINEILKGGKVIFEDKKGKQRNILVTGINV